MISNRALGVMVLPLAVGLSLAACSLNPKADPTRYYVLATLEGDPGMYAVAGLQGETPEQASLSSGPHLDVSIGVGPVTLPAYLARPRMATRVSDNELEYLEASRWAQPLDESLSHVVASNLRLLLWSERVVVHPWYSTRKPDYAVSVDVLRFERGSTGAVSMHARWSLSDAEGAVLASSPFERELPADGAAISAAVGAQSQLVAAMSREIADAVRRVAS